MDILIASKNKHKIEEISAIFNNSGIKIHSLNDFNSIPDIIEDKNTFVENAKLKAEGFYNYFKMPVIADDTGLCVECLNNEPGVFSARYTGENSNDKLNREKLLNNIKKHNPPYKAFFETVIYFFDGLNHIIANGRLNGKIITEERGNNGFGYDPIFVPDGHNKTLAELSFDEKNLISHRSLALKDLYTKLQQNNIIK
ncbi:MAG TPA: RdgB/HAM1 family non-canonical purine NTP pyrophosphatase [Ignavibacteriales bacterium]|nr:RdgB/HAM1 family non-canonical purine NTP pyrophosphatase [Ignavibacteriales bacterium]HOL81989.1 RdgB/HAM1 family non-canonical purine NTP pyrophosphatase [Ignavibacteriales bacterium]HOM64967.1 RdgB/HAM1 family non-canonical purine NTP pyrophosphatase [Ignavibacteriales bacterium]HPD68319.1 RdgB/HAM1 family non-canonical purine NTP pyrophosphatase [Ignavibacteriales bacterium]HPP34126.1 RdgB/HAM1 family non-canonical purine NTP pyrophosphatase [Ignavibacteriales bacterium]